LKLYKLLKKILIMLKKLFLRHLVICQMKKVKIMIMITKNKQMKMEPVAMITKQRMEIV